MPIKVVSVCSAMLLEIPNPQTMAWPAQLKLDQSLFHLL